jgi:uncharacterized protein YodC (DUF2158 family)
VIRRTRFNIYLLYHNMTQLYHLINISMFRNEHATLRLAFTWHFLREFTRPEMRFVFGGTVVRLLAGRLGGPKVLFVWSESSTTTKCNEFFSGYQPCRWFNGETTNVSRTIFVLRVLKLSLRTRTKVLLETLVFSSLNRLHGWQPENNSLSYYFCWSVQAKKSLGLFMTAPPSVTWRC